MSEVEIRCAHYKDWKALALVHSESYRSAYRGIIPDDYLDEFTAAKREIYYQKALTEGTEKIALLIVDSKAVGCMIVGKSRDDDLDDTYGEIEAIYLLVEHRGNGLGKMFLNWGIDRLKELGYSNTSLWVLKENRNAIIFYERLGFVFDGAERLITRGKELVQVRCQKIMV
ncbi:GNAT family N-acetyltransferase [Paenibacillus sp. LMG 31456]|uniref:GNAT family N-acetyltransferase n=1 Tax=Paenibacillus foliorum TaxID=2654974 RepID=A0A972GMK4_9BACL|nr:GNAT family N-acetyltransferase [Paenibacillus foliorum]NOU93551.1 GNAT family N-acetyltransferase [Paenibacillus foliorum]